MYRPPEQGQPGGEWRVFACGLDELAPLLDRAGAELGLVAGPPPDEAPGPEGRGLVWHRPGDVAVPAELVLFARGEGRQTALLVRARAPSAGAAGLLESDAQRHAFSLVAGALSSGLLSVGISLLMLGPAALLTRVALVGLTAGSVALSILAIWGLCAAWAQARSWHARARASRLGREAAARLFSAVERALRRAGPYR